MIVAYSSFKQKGAREIRITGAVINALAILVGGGVGLLLMGKISDKIAGSMIRAIGLCVLIIGISGALRGDIMLLVVSLAVGTFAGELLRIDDRLNKLGELAQSKFARGSKNTRFAEGFITTTLLFCVGAMAIVGSIDSGLRDDQSVIFTKSILDGVSAMIFASTLGFGVLFSAGAVLVYQGLIEFFAGYLQNVLTSSLVTEISAVGGVMIMAIGVNMVVETKIKVANLLPGFIVAVGYYYIFLR